MCSGRNVSNITCFSFAFQIRYSELLLIVVEGNKIVSSLTHDVSFVFAFDFQRDDCGG
jgi:hypothetical protein